MEEVDSAEQVTGPTPNYRSARYPSFEMQQWQRVRDMERVGVNGGFIV